MNRHAIIPLILTAALTTALASCGRDGAQPLRKETLRVYTSNAGEDLSVVQVAPEGEPGGTIHVLSSEKLDFKYEAENDEWLSILSINEDEEGHYIITYSAEGVSNTLEERYGVLSMTCAEKYFGRFVKLRQGYSLLYKNNFNDTAEGCVILNRENREYNTGYIDAGINKTYYNYVTFNAFAVRKSGQSFSFPLKLSILGGGVMDDTWSEDASFDITLGSSAGKDNFHYVLVSNKGERMSGSTRFVFSYEEDEDVDIHIDNFTVCTVSEDDRSYNPDEDPEQDED